MSIEKRRVIDMHTHIWLPHYKEDREELIKASEVYGINKIIISPLSGYYPEVDELALLNRLATETVRMRPDLFDAYVYLNPRHENTVDVLRKGIEEDGKVGVKLWVATFCDDPLTYPIYEECIKYDVPVLIHSFIKTVGQLEYETRGNHVHNIAQRYPEAKLIMAHLSSNCYHGIKAIRNDKNVWVDFCGSIYRQDDLDYTVRQIGTDRILYGTDMPGSFVTNYGQVLEADITEKQRDDIFYGNAAKLFNRLNLK